MQRILVQTEDFDAGAELARLADDTAGGLASFIGIVRAKTGDANPITALTLEHYPGMTEKALARIAIQAAEKFPISGCTIIHRTGRLTPGQNIVFIGAASPHRAAALNAVNFLIDYLKTSAPFWKSETYQSGETKWVQARESDEQAAAAWGVESK
jgi:molybdopterin synthase catalytic subunit